MNKFVCKLFTARVCVQIKTTVMYVIHRRRRADVLKLSEKYCVQNLQLHKAASDCVGEDSTDAESWD